MDPLTPREHEVLSLIAEGYSNQEIAQELYIEVSTVKVHTRNIFGKLDVNDRNQAVSRAMKLGVFSPWQYL
jgi:LuxR family maltose regulon positive regulatory protein